MQISSTKIAFHKLYIGDSKEKDEFSNARKALDASLNVHTTNHLAENDARILATKNIKPKEEGIIASERYDAFINAVPESGITKISIIDNQHNKEIATINLKKKEQLPYNLSYQTINTQTKNESCGLIKYSALTILELIGKVLKSIENPFR